MLVWLLGEPCEINRMETDTSPAPNAVSSMSVQPEYRDQELLTLLF